MGIKYYISYTFYHFKVGGANFSCVSVFVVSVTTFSLYAMLCLTNQTDSSGEVLFSCL